MHEIVQAERVNAPPAPKPAKEPRISKRLRSAINLLETGECKTQTAAAERSGLHPVYLSRALRKVEIQAFIARKRAENISVGALRASHRFVQLIDAESEHVAAKVSERILEQSGDLKSQGSGTNVNVSIGLSPGYVIDLTPLGQASQPPALIEHERSDDAKPLTDNDNA